MATTITGYLKKVLNRAPVAIILNGGERYLGVVGSNAPAWAADPKVVAAKGELSWPEYCSRQQSPSGNDFQKRHTICYPGPLHLV